MWPTKVYFYKRDRGYYRGSSKVDVTLLGQGCGLLQSSGSMIVLVYFMIYLSRP